MPGCGWPREARSRAAADGLLGLLALVLRPALVAGGDLLAPGPRSRAPGVQGEAADKEQKFAAGRAPEILRAPPRAGVGSRRASKLDGFSPKPAYGDSLPGAWEDLLRYAPGEAGLCAELRSAVASVPGPKDSITLLRYLRARQGKVEKAADMYTASMRWRRETGWDDGFRKNTIDDSLHKRLDDYWKPLGLLGFDREGDPLLWEQMGTCHMASLAKLSVDVVERHEAYSLTRIVQALEDLSVRRGRPFMYFTVVEVLEGIGPQHFNRKGLQTYQKVVRIGEDYYPEMMKRAILIHAPWIFEKLWMVVSRFFDEGTRNKMQIVGPARSYDVLTKYISPEWIPEKWGGHLHVCSNSSCSPILVPSAPVPEALIEAINASPSSY